jgi:hypothetical protein
VTYNSVSSKLTFQFVQQNRAFQRGIIEDGIDGKKQLISGI